MAATKYIVVDETSRILAIFYDLEKAEYWANRVEQMTEIWQESDGLHYRVN